MSKNMNTAIATYIEDKAHELVEQRHKWEEGTYKRSNEELYELLGSCLDFHNDVRGDAKKCKALNDYLRRKNISFNEGSSLATRIVRAVFNSSFQKRAYGYARVITIASEEKLPDETMSDFISKRGGIEELRRMKRNGKSPADERKDHIAIAKANFATSKALATPVKVQASTRKINDGTEHNLFVAVMRQESNGTYSIVFETSAIAVVNAALEQAGKEQAKMQKQNAAALKQREQEQLSDQAAEEAVNRALAA